MMEADVQRFAIEIKDALRRMQRDEYETVHEGEDFGWYFRHLMAEVGSLANVRYEDCHDQCLINQAARVGVLAMLAGYSNKGRGK